MSFENNLNFGWYRFQSVWEELCVDRDEYERKCKQRIQRQLEIGYILTYIFNSRDQLLKF